MRGRNAILILISFSLVLHTLLALFVLPSFQLVKYPHAADLLLNGQLKGERILDFSPSYLYLNVFLRMMNASPGVLLVIQILFTTASAVILFRILQEQFGGLLAFSGSLVFLFDISSMVFTHTFEPESLLVLFVLCATFFVLRNSPRAAFAGGLCLGLGIWTRPNFLPVVLIVPFWYFLKGSGKQWMKNSALFLIPVFLCVFGLWVRNVAVLGYVSPYVMNPGTVWYEGNNPNSWGMSAVYPPVLNQLSVEYSKQPDYHHQLYREFARRITGKPLSLPEVNSYWINHAFQYLRDHPSHTIRLFTTKFFHIFHSYQWHDLANSYVAEASIRKSVLPYTPFALLSALSIAGLFVLAGRWKQYLIFFAMFFSQFFSMLTIYVSGRQRVSLLFLFIFFACGALRFLWRTRNRNRWILLPAIFLLLIFFQRKTDFMREEEHLWNHVLASQNQLRDAYRLRSEGKLTEAAEIAAQAVSNVPWSLDSKRPANLSFPGGYLHSAIASLRGNDPASRMDQAVLLLENGQAEEAQKIFLELMVSGYRLKRDDQQSSNLHYYLARCDLLRAQKENAIDHLRAGNQESPGDPWILSMLAALTNETDSRDQLFRYFDDVDAQFFLGRAYLETQQPEKAVPCFRYVIQIIPEFRKAYIDLAAALARVSRDEEAAAVYRKAIQMAPDPVFRETDILDLFKRLAENKSSALSKYSYGIVLRQFGYYPQALQQQEQASLLDPSQQEIQQEISMLKKAMERNRN